MDQDKLQETMDSLRPFLEELKDSYKYLTTELLGKRLNYVNK
jgi:hypothetical protein